MIFDGLNPNQLQAVTTRSRSALVLAGAGSGKTGVLTRRIAHLIEDRGVSAHNILALTFTRKAANEMKERLTAMVGESEVKKMWIGTFHAISLRILEQHGYKLGYQKNITVYDEIDQKDIFASIISELGLKTDLKELSEEMQDYASDCDRHEFEEDKKLLVTEYRNRLKEYNAVDFALLLTEVLRLCREHKDVYNALHDKFRYVFVDEYQDVDRTQYYLHEALKPENLFVVGDVNQCQPTGTMVMVCEPGGRWNTNTIPQSIPIEKVKVGDSIVAFDRHSQAFIKSGKVLATARRSFSGKMYRIQVDGKTTNSTDNHKWLVRWDKSIDEKKYVVYMMCKGDKYRIGVTNLFRSMGNCKHGLDFGLSMRMNQEDADQGWILKVFDTPAEARLYEAVVSVNWGIPQLTFKPQNKSVHFTQDQIDSAYSQFEQQEVRAKECLSAHGRSIQYPLVDRTEKKGIRRGRKTLFEVRACNLISKYMQVPVVPDGPMSTHKYGVEWKNIEVTEHIYHGEVHSLSVSKYRSYVSDGIVTLNCIYSWRGSDISIIKEFEASREGSEVIILDQSYRCGKKILEAANNLIYHNPKQYDIQLWTERGDGFLGGANFAADPAGEALAIVTQIDYLRMKLGHEFRDIAVLTRTHRQHEIICKTFQQKNIPFLLVGKEPDFWKRTSGRMIVSILKILHNQKNTWHFNRICRAVIYPMSESEWYETEARALRTQKSSLQLLVSERKGNFFELLNWYEQVGRSLSLQTVTDKLLSLIPLSEYFLLQSLTTKAMDVMETFSHIYSWESKNEENKTVSAFLEWIASQEIQTEIEENRNAVKVATIHSVKGLEFPVVFIAGMVEGKLPSNRAKLEGSIEEERRLAYVAITRAKDRLYLSSYLKHDSHGGPASPSRFIGEMNVSGNS